MEKHPLNTIPLELGVSCKAGLLFLNIFSRGLFFYVLILGSFRFASLWARLMEMLVKALHSVSEESWFKFQPCYQAPSDHGVKEVSNPAINMGLVMLPLDSGPKLAEWQ